MSVPEEGQFFLEGAGRTVHAVEPPELQAVQSLFFGLIVFLAEFLAFFRAEA